MTFDVYLWIKAFHVASAIVFVSGVLGVALFLAAFTGEGDAFARTLRHWDQRVTMPAMLLTWSLGLALGLMGNWFQQEWLIAKLAFVVALSAMHGVQSGRLRRMAGGQPSQQQPFVFMPLVAVGSVIAIVVLVVVKPG